MVNEVNLPPVFQTIAAQSGHYGSPLAIQAVATDSDIPTNTLSFSLVSPPAGMTIDAATGAIAWTPAKTDVGTKTITVRVTDNGLPGEGATTTFQLTVGGGEARLTVQMVAGLIQVTCTGDTGLNYELQKSSDLVTWEKIVQFTTNYTYIEPAAENAAQRFYRLKLVQ